MSPGQRELPDREDPPARTRRRGAAAGQGEALDAGRHDPPVHDPEPSRDRAFEAVAERGGHAQAGVPGDDRIVEVDDEGAVGVHQLGQAALDPPVGLDGAVAVEVIGRHVGVEGDRRAPRQAGQLELGELVDDAVVGT